MIKRLADSSTSLFWLLNIGGWAAYAVLNYLMGIAGSNKSVDYIWPSLMYAVGGLVITYGLRRVYKSAWSMRPTFSLPVAGAGAIVAAALFAGFRSFVYLHIYEGFRLGTLPLSKYFYSWELTLSFYVIGTWSGLYYGIKYYRELQQQREQVLKATATAQRAQLRTLRYQLNPHFLFNTLNAISTLVLEGEKVTATRMLARLSAFLRHSLDRDPMKKITLRKEIEAIDLYLRLEEVRFDDRLNIEHDIDDFAYGALVPSMILQPLIENAVKHAITENESGGCIVIAAKTRDDMLCLSVADTGPGLPDPERALSRSENGVGLVNIRERLQVLYGDAHTFRVNNVQPHGLEVEMCIPLERKQ